MRKELKYVLAFLIPLVTMCVVFAFNGFYPFGPYQFLEGDYTFQYIPLYRSLGRVFTEGDWGGLFYSWSKNLGGNMAPVYGFNSFSPLTWLIALTPPKYIVLITSLTSLLRYGLCGLTFYHYLNRRFEMREWIALTGSTTYALNGFLTFNLINPNFLDNLIILPLILIGVEKLLDGEQTKSYAYLLAAAIITQFYTGYMICLFIGLYALYYLFSKQLTLNRLFPLIKQSLIGVGLSAFVLLPIIFGLLESKGSTGATFVSWLTFNNNPLELAVKFIIGSNFDVEFGDMSALPTFYVGSLAIVALTLYFTGNLPKRDKLVTGIALVITAVIFTNENLQRLFHMGQMPFGFIHRNAWLLSAFLTILMVKALAQVDKVKPLPIMLTTGVITGLAYWQQSQSDLELVTPLQLAITVGLIISWFLAIKFSKKFLPIFAVLIMAVDFGLHAVMVNNKLINDYAWEGVDKSLLSPEITSFLSDYNDKGNRLLDSNDSTWNNALIHGFSGVNHFTSSIERKPQETLGKMGLAQSTSISAYNGGTPLTDTLFNLAYQYDYANYVKRTARTIVPKDYETVASNGYHLLRKNPYQVGLGISANRLASDLSDDPITNHNLIGREVFGAKEALLKRTEGYSTEYVNLIPDPNNPNVLVKEDKTKPAKVRVTFTPTNNNSYYLSFEGMDSYFISRYTMTLNGQPYTVDDRFNTTQLWAVANQEAHFQKVFEIEIAEELTPFPNKGAVVTEFNNELFKQLTQTTTGWNPSVTTRSVKGEINQPKGKNLLLTSIPYSKGWKVSVDGKGVKTKQVYESLLAIDLKPGHHQITMRYQPPGLIPGAFITTISLLLLHLKKPLKRLFYFNTSDK